MKKLIGVLISSLFVVLPLCASADIIGQVTLIERANAPSQYVYFASIGYSVNALLDYELSLNGGAYTEGFCVEGRWGPPGAAGYTLLSIDDSLGTSFGLNATNYEAAAYVANLWKSGLVSKEAAQLAIWEITTDGINGSFSAGNFQTGASQYTTKAQEILDAIALLTFSSSDTWALAVNPQVSGAGTVSIEDYQNYLVQRVPEPGILILLGIALSAVGLVARRLKLVP